MELNLAVLSRSSSSSSSSLRTFPPPPPAAATTVHCYCNMGGSRSQSRAHASLLPAIHSFFRSTSCLALLLLFPAVPSQFSAKWASKPLTRPRKISFARALASDRQVHKRLQRGQHANRRCLPANRRLILGSQTGYAPAAICRHAR